MSQLILNFFRKDDSLKLSVTATGHCNYEDHIEVDGKRAYELLVLSNNRKKNLNKYCSGLKTLLRNHSDIVRLEDSQPMTFCWRVNDVTYLSTSLFFEYYMSNLSNCLSKIKDALQSDLDSTPYKEAKETLIHLRGMFDEWNTQLLILPHTPHVVSLDFLQSLLCFTHGCHTLQVTPKLKDKSYGVALRTAMDSFGRVWPRHEYGEVAMHHYLVSRALLYGYVHDDESREASEKLTALLEAQKCLSSTRFQKCFLTKKILDKVNDLEHKLVDDIDVLKNTYYAEETGLENVKIPESYNLIVCKKTQQFGCKCKE
jgi:hypothetical protein